MKKLTSLVLVVCTIFALLIGSLLQAPVAHAATQQTPVAHTTTQQEVVTDRDDSFVEAQASQRTVFFRGIGVAWVIDATITYFTGKPPVEWIVMGLTRIESAIKSIDRNTVLSRPIYVSSNGQVSSCVVFPCAVATKQPVENTMDLKELFEKEQ